VRNNAGKGDEWGLSYDEDIEEAEMERMRSLSLISGSCVILDISPGAWESGHTSTTTTQLLRGK
jgi:hypothetical protein